MLIRSVVYNVLGLGLPLLGAVVAIPILIDGLGAASFGVLTIVWAFVSYFSLFDLGLGRALTQQVAVTLARDEGADLPGVTGTAYGLMALLGLAAGLLLAALTPLLVDALREVPDPAQARAAFYAMACAVPFVVLTSGLRGVLEAHHAFGVINAIRLPLGLFTFLGPVGVLWYAGPDLALIAWVLVAARVLAFIAHWSFALRAVNPLHRGLAFDGAWIKPLFRQGGWMSVSNAVSPLMGYLDRFIIGIVVSSVAIAWYVTPNEIITKLWIIPGALTSVLFPLFAARMISSPGEARVLFQKSIYWLFVAMLPPILLLILMARELLTLWIDAQFAEQSYRILQWMAVGMLINTLAHIPFTLIQSSGHARIAAFVHLVQLPFYALALYLLARHYGVVGVAIGWALRMLVDTLAMYVYALPIVGLGRADVPWLKLTGAGLALGSGTLLSLGLPWTGRLVVVGVVSLVVALVLLRALNEALRLKGASSP